MARSNTGSTSNYFNYSGAVASTYPLTMACWFYITGSRTNAYYFMEQDNGTTAKNRFGLFVGANPNDCVRCQVGDGFSFSTTASDIGDYTSDTWQHAVGRFTSATDRDAAQNGVWSSTSTDNVTPGTLTNTKLGVLQDGVSGLTAPLDGYLADCAIWNVALTNAEVASLAAGLSPLFVRPSALQAYWPLGGFWGSSSSGNETSFVGSATMTETGTMGVPSTHPWTLKPNANKIIIPTVSAAVRLPKLTLLGVG